MRRIFKMIIACYAFLILTPCACLFADTITRKDGSEIKGVVVEEYKDRLVFSTADGEIKIMKSDIRNIILDDEDANLIRLAEKARSDGDYAKAAGYYEKALAITPGSRAAKDGLLFIQLRSYQKDVANKAADIEKMAMIDQSGFAPAKKTESAEVDGLKKRLMDSIGMSLVFDKGFPVVERLKENMPAQDAGIMRGDRIVAIWGRLTGYLSLEEVMDILLNKGSMEVRCTVERTVKVPMKRGRNAIAPADRIDASLGIGPEGLAIFSLKDGGLSARAGLDKADLIVAIDGMPTRYLQLGRALALIGDSEGDSVKLTFRRDVVIWKGGA
jgi:predicted metalloprotease with PDZ domain